VVGPLVYAAGLEVLRRAEESDDNALIRALGVSAMRSNSPQSSGIFKHGTDLDSGRGKLYEAMRSQIRNNSFYRLDDVDVWQQHTISIDHP